jgi:hypothetical protein
MGAVFMIEIEGYKETPMYTIEQVRNVIENVNRTLKLEAVKVLFNENTNTLNFVVNTKEGSKNFIEARFSFDLTTKQPKIIINYKDLEKTWFHSIFDEKFNTAQERSAVFYLRKRLAFVTRVSTLLEFIENDHCVISFLMTYKEMTKKVYKVSDLIDSNQVLFELFCFKVFADEVISTAESVQDLIENFDKHVALNEMKTI